MKIIDGLPPQINPDVDVALDIEMFGQEVERLHRPHGIFASAQVCTGEDVYITTDQRDLPELFKRIKDAKSWILHNATYDIAQLRRFVPIKKRFLWDTMLVEKILWGGYYGQGEFALEDLVRRYLNVVMDKGIRTQFAEQTYMTEGMKKYAALDAYYTLKVKQVQDAEITKRGYDNYTYLNIDEPCIWSVLDMQPIRVNPKRWMEMAEDFVHKGQELENRLGINVYSSKQVKEFLLRRLGKKLKSTAAEFLEEIGDPLTEDILLARQYRKASSTYGQKWIERYLEEGDLVYSNWNVTGAETGRMSSSSPNLQQIPSRKIPEYRKLFMHSKGRLLVADVQAQEPRCLAVVSGDKNLRAIFDNREDVHLIVTRAAFNDDTITKSDPRRDEVGKTINLATSYGMSAEGMAKRMHIEVKEAERFLAGYFARFNNVRNWIDRQRNVAFRQGYVTSVSGRRVWVNPYNHSWENNAINSPIQGSAADFTKMWMNKMWEACASNKLPFAVAMVIHDEMVLDIEKGQEAVYKELLKKTADETATTLFGDMPFEINMVSGINWGCKKEEQE